MSSELEGQIVSRGGDLLLDRYFTSNAVADWCLEKNITITGTLRSDRKGIPKEMKTGANREEKSSKWCYRGNKQARSGPARGLEKKKGTSIRKY